MLVVVVIGLWVVLYGLPDIIFHHLQWGAFFGARDSHRVALTFDDGPDRDTSEILDALAEQHARATFFVVAEQARRHPETVRRMVQEGHQIGIHALSHRPAFLIAPWSAYFRLKEAIRIVTDVAGVRPTVYRPPWGEHSLAAWWSARKLGLVRVLWSVAPDDWRPDRDPDRIVRHVVQLTLPGGVVVFHDGGGERTRTARALPAVIGGLRALNLEPVRVDELPRDRSELRRIWTWWETRFTRGWDIDTIPSGSGGDPVLRLGRIRYRGRPLKLPTGRWLKPGDPFAEIHFGNPALSQMSHNVFGGVKALHAVIRGLADVARFIETSEKYRDVVAVGGVTLLDASRAIEKVGLTRMRVTGWQKWSMWIYLTVLMSIYHQQGWRTLRRFFHLHPVLVAMDRKTLERRLPPK